MEAAACQLLLGDAAAAEATLGLAPGAPRAADPGVRDFVLARSPGPASQLGCGAGAALCGNQGQGGGGVATGGAGSQRARRLQHVAAA